MQFFGFAIRGTPRSSSRQRDVALSVNTPCGGKSHEIVKIDFV
jgi:hypothetical protein